jgi:UDP-N-acetylglucosamine--N-acetylmuramyl-(pentapeptide) pyrophosphoryl-undecaprenol N-acetylglucosamine transferase
MTVVIAAGGTGGHLYPGVALGREFLRRDASTCVRFVGTARGIEVKVLPHEGFPLDIITALPVMGLRVTRALLALAVLPRAVRQSVALLRRHRADLVIGIGGYTSPPVLTAAFLLGIPRVILEPNAYPGKANMAMAPLAHRIFLAFQSAARHFSSRKVRVSGTPVRRAFLETCEAPPPKQGNDRHTLLVFGGSRGAHGINLAMLEAVPYLRSSDVMAGWSIIHQTGEADYERVKSFYEASSITAEVVSFVFDMPRVLRSADLVIARAGAMTLAELTACGKPAILVPFPHAIYQHQAHNARVLEEAGAAVVVSQHELSGATLADALGTLLRDVGRLADMSERSRSLGRHDSAECIVDECLALLRERRPSP